MARRFIGVSLGGGKSDRTSAVLLEYFPEYDRLFLREIHLKMASDDGVGSGKGDRTGDEKLIDLVKFNEPHLASVAFDTAVGYPPCLSCKLKCPGYEKCKEPHIAWLWDNYRKRRRAKKNARLFTPYTERAAEYWMSTELEEVFHPEHALGSNMAPLLARGRYLARRLHIQPEEVFAALSVWRIGKALGVGAQHLRAQSRSLEKDECRKVFLEALLECRRIFIYQQDIQRLVDSAHGFDAFICALTAFLNFIGQCEKAPKGFPKKEVWVEFPVKSPDWLRAKQK